MIEIMSETEVKIHFQFVHPHYYNENYQRIYMSDDFEHIIDRLKNQ